MTPRCPKKTPNILVRVESIKDTHSGDLATCECRFCVLERHITAATASSPVPTAVANDTTVANDVSDWVNDVSAAFNDLSATVNDLSASDVSK